MNVETGRFIRAHTTKVRELRIGRWVNPSTAELKRWLHDRRTPRSVRTHLYAALLVRRARAAR